MSEPKTAHQFNSPLVGEFVVTSNSPQTIASGYAQQMAWQREHEEVEKIKAALRPFIQDELIIQQAARAIHKALFSLAFPDPNKGATMYKKRSNLGLAVIVAGMLATVLFASGCPKDPYRAAIQGSSDVSQAVSSGIKITSQYYSAGTFNDSQKATAAKYFTIVTDCNFTFRHAVVGVHNSGQTGAQAYLTIADSFVSCVHNSAPVSADPKVANVLQAVDTAIRGISVAVASAKGAK